MLSPDPKQDFDLKKGQFVRIKSSGLYHGDVGVIHDINVDQKKVSVRLVPRIGAENKEPGHVRPAQKLF